MPGHTGPDPTPQNTEPQGSQGHRNRADWGRREDQQPAQHVGHAQCRGGPEGEPVLQVWQLGGIIGLGSPTRVVRPRLPVDFSPGAGWTARRQPTGPDPLTDPARTPTPLPIIERPTSSFLGNLQNFG